MQNINLEEIGITRIIPAARPRAVTILAWLLLGESLSMLLLGIYHFVILSFGPQLLRQWWRGDRLDINQLLQQLFGRAAEEKLLLTLVESLILFFLTVLVLLAALGFFARWRSAWLTAMFVQGSALLLGLVLYIVKRPFHIYWLMGFAVFLVMYLNVSDVYQYFHAGQNNGDSQEGVNAAHPK